MLNSTYAPDTWQDVKASKVVPLVVGVSGTANANTTTNIDYTIPDDSLIRSIQPIIQNSNFGDLLNLYVIDTAGVYAPANTILANPINNYYISTSAQDQAPYDAVAPFKIKGGLTLRFAYTNVNLLAAASVKLNLQLLKVLE